MLQYRHNRSLVDEGDDHLLAKPYPPSCLSETTSSGKSLLCTDESMYCGQMALLIVSGE
jgi:hypothetical protein